MDAQIKNLVKLLDGYYAKLPSLPKGLNDFIVSVAPWLALVFGVLAILSGIAAFGFLSVLSPFAAVAGATQYALTGLLAALVLIVQGVVEILAFPSLKSRKVRGWNLIFLSLLLMVVSSIFYLNIFGIVQSLIGVLIGYYFLYQIKSYYK